MCYILFELSKHLLLFFPPKNNISEMTHLLSPGGGDFYPKAIWFPQVHELSTSDGLRNFLPSIVLRGWQTPLVSCKKLLVLPWSWLFHRSREEGLPPLELSCLRPGVPNSQGHRLLPVHGLLGTGPHSWRWAVGTWVKLHLHLQPLPVTHINAWALLPVRSAAVLDSHRLVSPTVNCAWEGSSCTLLMRISLKSHPHTKPWKYCLPRNQSLLPNDLSFIHVAWPCWY